MSTYDLLIGGDKSLDQIEIEVRAEEAGASEFRSSRIVGSDNQATFLELAAGTLLPQIDLLRGTDPAPAGKRRIWSGQMVVAGTSTAVAVYRK